MCFARENRIQMLKYLKVAMKILLGNQNRMARVHKHIMYTTHITYMVHLCVCECEFVCVFYSMSHVDYVTAYLYQKKMVGIFASCLIMILFNRKVNLFEAVK